MLRGQVLKEGFSKFNIHKFAFVDNGYSTGVCFGFWSQKGYLISFVVVKLVDVNVDLHRCLVEILFSSFRCVIGKFSTVSLCLLEKQRGLCY